ncbi:MAG: hypothetical protein QNK05_09445 [Myxococcota bacterium]|nr:hypothetical protein [Myxococcota bacterium]
MSPSAEPLSFGSRLLRLLPSLLVFLLAAVPTQAEPEGAAVPDHARHPLQIVGIAGQQLIPTVQQVAADASFGWLNYSGRDASVRFEDEDIVKKMRCTTPGFFRVTANDLEAPRIKSGEIATLCALEPGEYDYRVVLDGNASEPLLGKLVVGGR